MLQFSIIVPLLDSVDAFERSLASALRYRPLEAQILGVHDGNYRDPHGLAAGGEVDWALADGSRRAALWSAGLARSQGDVVIWLHPGTEFSNDWGRFVAEAFTDPRVASAGPLLHDSQGRCSVQLCGVAADWTGARELKVASSPSPSQDFEGVFGPAALVGAFRRSAIELVEFPPLVEDSYWDLDLAWSLRALGFATRVLPEWRASTDRLEDLLRGSRRPHGCDAMRAVRRYGQSPLSWWTAALADLATCLSKPARLRQAWGRFQSRFQVSSDADVARQLRACREALEAVQWRLPAARAPADASRAHLVAPRRRAA